jgi:hypothetical protein
VPAGATCKGTVAGQNNVCMVKLVNPSKAGVSTSSYLETVECFADVLIAIWRLYSRADGRSCPGGGKYHYCCGSRVPCLRLAVYMATRPF